jgi:hypothetical protein
MLKVSFKEDDYQRIMNALRKLDVLGPVIVGEDMQRRCATDFYQLVFENIVNQKFKHPAYYPRYGNWKMGVVGHQESWVLKGDLLEALTAFKSGKSGWMGGIPAGVMDSGGKSWKGELDQGPAKYIAKYARILEFNRTKPRPVFKPTTQEYAGEGWPKQGREALREVGNLWR